MGDGEQITVFGNPWIPHAQNPYIVKGKPLGVCNFKVKDLIDWSSLSWRRPIANQLFPKELVQEFFPFAFGAIN